MGDNNSGSKPNDDRADVINPNNPKHQKALDEHSRARNPKDPSNTPGTTRQSNPPGQGKR